MAKGAPKGKGAKAGKVVGYGQEGKAFHNQTNYNKSAEGQRHAKNPALSNKPVGTGKKGDPFFSKAKFNASKSGPLATKSAGPGQVHQPPPHAHTAVTPMPGHPSGNPTQIHGPATTGNIKVASPSGRAPRAPAAPRGGMPGGFGLK